MIPLRPYQADMIDRARVALRGGCRRLVIQGATGMGKTCLIAHMLASASARGKRAWFIVHRRELVRQSVAMFKAAADLRVGVIAAGYEPDPSALVQVCSVQSLARRLARVAPPDLLVYDECHHICASTWGHIAKTFPETPQIGLSATPQRLDSRGLGEYFDELIVGPPIGTLIDGGYLAPTVVYAPPSPADLAGLRVRAGDYATDETAARMDKPHITGDAIAHYRRLCDREPAICFTVTLAHAEHVAAQFRDAGYRAQRIDGGHSDDERAALITALGTGGLDVLVSCELIGEGIDIPIVAAAILLRPTASLTIHLQQVGRAMRPAPGKTRAIILDHVGNTGRHGLPDEPREWSLEGRKRKAGSTEGAVAMRQCQACFCCHRPAPVCPECGYRYPILDRRPDVVAGELVPVVARVPLKHDLRRARTREDLEAIARARGYARGWVQHILRARHSKEARA